MRLSSPSPQDAPPPPAERIEPAESLVPLVFASPHSGAYYPHDFIEASSLELATLRKSEDCYVDELFSDAPGLGAPLLRALYPRAYVDVNREPYELDPEMFEHPLPSFVNTTSARVAAGLGTIARIVGARREIYRDKLSFDEAERRIIGVHKPYHQALRSMVARARERFGFAILIDCHSMPSSGLPMDLEGAIRPVDIVLGDCSGTSCHNSLTNVVAEELTRAGYHVIRNNPYAGGYTTQHYGDPANGLHALQIELGRNLYMDEVSLQRRSSFVRLQSDLKRLIARLISYAGERRGDLQYQRLSAE